MMRGRGHREYRRPLDAETSEGKNLLESLLQETALLTDTQF